MAVQWPSWRHAKRMDLRVHVVDKVPNLPDNCTYVGVRKVQTHRSVQMNCGDGNYWYSPGLEVTFNGGLKIYEAEVTATVKSMMEIPLRMGVPEWALLTISEYGYPWWLHCALTQYSQHLGDLMFTWFWGLQFQRLAVGDFSFSVVPLTFGQCNMAAEMVSKVMDAPPVTGLVPSFVKRFAPDVVLSVGDFTKDVFTRNSDLLSASEEYYLSNGDSPFLRIYRWCVMGPFMTQLEHLCGQGSEVEHASEILVATLFSLAYGYLDQLVGYLNHVREKRLRSRYAFREKPSASYPDNSVRQTEALMSGVSVEMKLIGKLKEIRPLIPGVVIISRNGKWELLVTPTASTEDIIKVVEHYKPHLDGVSKFVATLQKKA
jgi:hypothetical protein